MEPIVIRWGAGGFDPPPAPATLDDVARALDGIASGRLPRPEFTLEYVTSRRLEDYQGRKSIVWVAGKPYLSVAHFVPDDEAVPAGWSVVFDEHREETTDPDDPAKDRYILVLDDRQDAPFVEGNCCGATLTVRSNSIVPPGMVLLAVEWFLSRGERAIGLGWLPESLLYQPPKEELA
jgi:hypothetical protein